MAVIGITGGSGSGKSTLALTLRNRLGRSRCATLCLDSYYHDLSALPPAERAETDFDVPAAVDLDLLAAHLRALKAGKTVRPPRYDFATHTRSGEGDRVFPREHVIVEGLFLMADETVAAAIDLLLYVETPDGTRLARRIARDTAERGRTDAEVIRRWEEHTRPSCDAHVLPARGRADLIVSGEDDFRDVVNTILLLLSH
ncbi:MAG: uridine kinase [Planctomycetota bacterium]